MDAGAQSRWQCPELAIKLILQPVCFFIWISQARGSDSESFPVVLQSQDGAAGRPLQDGTAREPCPHPQVRAEVGNDPSPELPRESLLELWASFCSPAPTLRTKSGMAPTCSNLGEIRPIKRLVLPLLQGTAKSIRVERLQ